SQIFPREVSEADLPTLILKETHYQKLLDVIVLLREEGFVNSEKMADLRKLESNFLKDYLEYMESDVPSLFRRFSDEWHQVVFRKLSLDILAGVTKLNI